MVPLLEILTGIPLSTVAPLVYASTYTTDPKLTPNQRKEIPYANKSQTLKPWSSRF